MSTELQKNDENNGLIAISKAMARAKDRMTMQETKLAFIMLSKIEWKNMKNNLEIWVEKSEIMKLLGSEIDSSDQSAYLRKLAQSTVHHSDLCFDGEDQDEWEDMPLFTRRKSTKNMLMMEIYSGIAKHIQGLECEYITLFLGDILKFDSNTDGLRAYILYEYLRLNSDTRRINSRIISTKEFKELFGIPKDGKGSYMRQNGKFDRNAFEKRVIEPVLNMLAKSEHVVLHNYGKTQKGEFIYYSKIKKHGMVQGYELTYSINKRPQKIKRETLIDVQAQPEVLKVAQDLINGKKAQSDKPKKNSFHNFSSRNYTKEQWEEIERQIINCQNN
jgi:hypothetical protein